MADILIEQAGPVLRAVLDRPDKKNAITTAMYAALVDVFRQADNDRSIRVVLIHGNGDAFTAGNDLRDFLEHPPDSAEAPVFQFMTTAVALRKPLVAAVHGLAVGIGTTLLLHCDLVFAAENTRFHMPFVDLGLVPEFGSSVLLPAMAGYHRAAELLMLGRPFDAALARETGLVNTVVPADQLLTTATAAAQALADKPPESIQLTKMLLKRAMMPAVEAAIQEEANLFVDRLRSSEAKAALAAFFDRRNTGTN